MRIDLDVGYHERRKAKALGARWDALKRVWYVIDPPDIRPFVKWLGSTEVEPSEQPAKTLSKSFGRTVSVIHCGCNVLPWDDCVHTLPISKEIA